MKKSLSEEKALFFYRITLRKVENRSIVFTVFRMFPNGDNREDTLIEELKKGDKEDPLNAHGVREFVRSNVARYKSPYSWVIEPSEDEIEFFAEQMRF
jgi:hypothetical protein